MNALHIDHSQSPAFLGKILEKNLQQESKKIAMRMVIARGNQEGFRLRRSSLPTVRTQYLWQNVMDN